MKTSAHNREWWLNGVPPWVMEIVHKVAAGTIERAGGATLALMAAQTRIRGTSEAPAPGMTDQASMVVSLGRYVRAGRQCFLVDRQLADALAITDVPASDDRRELSLPFDSFVIDVSAVYEGTRISHIGAVVWCDGDRLVCTGVVLHDRRLKRIIPWEIEWLVDEPAMGCMPRVRTPNSVDEGDRLACTVISNMTATIVNLVAYLNTPNPVVDVDTSHADAAAELEAKLERTKSPTKRRKLTKRLEKAPRHTINTIGRGYVSRKAKSAEGCDPRRLHWVRGHWRNQWVGVGDGRRQELRWIAPYQRGEIEPGVVSRTNVVTAEAIGLGGEL